MKGDFTKLNLSKELFLKIYTEENVSLYQRYFPKSGKKYIKCIAFCMSLEKALQEAIGILRAKKQEEKENPEYSIYELIELQTSVFQELEAMILLWIKREVKKRNDNE